MLQPVTPPQGEDAVATEPIPILYTNLDAGVSVAVYGGALHDIFAENARSTPPTRSRSGRRTSSSTPRESGQNPRRDRADRRAPPRRGLRPHSASVTLNSPAGADRANAALTVGTAAEGGFALDLRNLSATDGGFGSPDGSIQVRRFDLAHGRLRYDGDHIVLEAFDVPQVVVGELSWRIGDTGRLSSVGGATITNVRAGAEARLEPHAGDRRLATFTLHKLTIGQITAQDLRYRDGPLDISVPSRADRPRAGGTQRPDPHRRALATRRPAHGTGGHRPDRGRGRRRVRPPWGTVGRADWGFLGFLYAGALHVSLDSSGAITVAGENLGAAGKVHVKDLVDTEVEARGLTLPELKIDGNTITVPAGAGRMLRLGYLELSELDLRTGSLEMSTDGRQRLTLSRSTPRSRSSSRTSRRHPRGRARSRNRRRSA